MEITAYELALRYVGVKERHGDQDHPLIQWWLSLVRQGPHAHDEVPWCSAFVAGIAWELHLPRSQSAAARSWLTVGTPVAHVTGAIVGWDVTVLKRDTSAPGPEILHAAGHVGFFAGTDTDRTHVYVIGGNQGDAVSVASFPVTRILGIRRLA